MQLQNIDAIEKRLWEAADTLRTNSNYASNEYFMPVMGLMIWGYRIFGNITTEEITALVIFGAAMLFANAASFSAAPSAVDALPAASLKSAMLFIIVLGFGDAQGSAFAPSPIAPSIPGGSPASFMPFSVSLLSAEPVCLSASE